MAEIRLTMNDKFKARIEKIAIDLGISNTDYVKSLIIHDLKNRSEKK